MRNAVPSPIAPGPLAPLGTEHERHDQNAKERHQRQQRDEGVVSDAPDPVEQEGAPVPAVDFRRDGFRYGPDARLTHYRCPPLAAVIAPASGQSSSHRRFRTHLTGTEYWMLRLRGA